MTLQRYSILLAAAIELLAAFVIAVHVGRALIALRGATSGVDAARLVVAEGVLAALGFSLAATLLKVIGLQDWLQIRAFVTVLVLRTVLKQVFRRERASVERRRGAA